MDIFLKIVIYLLLLYVYISVFIFFYAAYTKRNLDHKPILGLKIFNNYFFFIGSLFGLIIFFSAGFEKALFFIPEDWGGIDEDGDWRSAKEGLSFIFALLTSVGLLIKSDKIFSKSEK